jgi:hypothetical protein
MTLCRDAFYIYLDAEDSRLEAMGLGGKAGDGRRIKLTACS